MVASLYVAPGINALFYLDVWLIFGTSPEQVEDHASKALSLAGDMGFAFIIPKSFLEPTQHLVWLGMVTPITSKVLLLDYLSDLTYFTLLNIQCDSCVVAWR